MAIGPTDKDILRDSGQESETDVKNNQPDYDNGFDATDEVGTRGGETWDDPSMADENDDLDNDLSYEDNDDEDMPMDEGVS